MIIGTIVVIMIGLFGAYLIATSVVKRILDIVEYLDGSIKNEFKESVPLELVENEDELGTIAKQMKYLENQISEMLASIKESIDYLNDKMSTMSDNGQITDRRTNDDKNNKGE